MNADQRRQIFEQLRYELRMAEGWADELNATKKSVSEEDAKILADKIFKAFKTSEKLRDSFAEKEGLPF